MQIQFDGNAFCAGKAWPYQHFSLSILQVTTLAFSALGPSERHDKQRKVAKTALASSFYLS